MLFLKLTDSSLRKVISHKAVKFCFSLVYIGCEQML